MRCRREDDLRKCERLDLKVRGAPRSVLARSRRLDFETVGAIGQGTQVDSAGDGNQRTAGQDIGAALTGSKSSFTLPLVASTTLR